MTPAQLERLRLEWYRKAGIEDTEGVDPRDALTNKHGSRSQDAQDVAFAGEMAEAARVLLTHPGLSQRERQVWALVVDGASYSRVAREVRCSYSVVSAAIDRCQALMLRPEWESHPVSDVPEKQPGRYVAVHAEGLPGRTACGAGVAGKRVEGGKLVTCKACRETMGASPRCAIRSSTSRKRCAWASRTRTARLPRFMAPQCHRAKTWWTTSGP